MSPSWREAVHLTLGARELHVRRTSRGWRPRMLGEARVAFDGTDAVAPALADALAALRGGPADAHVLLGDDHVRFALLDGATGLRGRAERDAAAAHALRRVYGASADGWRVCHSAAGRDVLVAAGIDTVLHQQLHAVLDAAQAPLASLRTRFGVSLTQCRRWLGQPSWFVCAEAERATLCFSDGQRLRSLRSHRVRTSLAQELPAWLERERLLDDGAAAGAGVVVAHRGAAPVSALQLGVPLRLVDLDAIEALA